MKICAVVVLVTGLISLTPWQVWASEPDFNRDVRPILSDKCYFCHGPDENDRQADLRLDRRSDEAVAAFASGDFLDRIHSDDPDFVMPPPDTKLSLTNGEKQVLKTWVELGGNYEAHWSFQPLPGKVDVPEEANSKWCRRTLDAFVISRLNAQGIRPTSEADPLRWLRRVTFDLTGLPPSIKQIEAFEKALSNGSESIREQVYEDTVDQLMASSQFGEHFAVAWLDAARYADSYGYQSDKLNTQWPYRDWVVRAFNDNLPYNQFLTWQLAGDLLPNPTSNQRLATAFNRIHRLNNEGGAVFEEWRIENVADRVHTFGTAVLGLTLECCRCHDHKYDPISTRDYYALSAFFNSIDESGVYDRTAKVPAPSILLPTPEQQEQLVTNRLECEQSERAYKKVVAAARERFRDWKANGGAVQEGPPDLELALSFDKPFDNSLKAIYHPSENDRGWTSPLDTVSVSDSPLPRILPHITADTADVDSERLAIRLDGERGITTSGIEAFDRWTPFTVVVSLKEPVRVPERAVIAHHTRGTDCGYNGWDLTIVDGHLESRLYRVWPGNGIGVRTTAPIPKDEWQQVTATYDGSSQARGLLIYLDGKPLARTVLRDNIKKSANVKVDHGGEFVLGQRFRARGLAGALVDDLRIFTRALSQTELVGLANGSPSEPTEDYYVSAIDEEARQALAELNAARHAFVMAEEAMIEVPIMKETQEPRETHVLSRGQYDAPTSDETRVERATFTSILPPMPKNAPRNRLGLAKWATDPNHPLTSRVIVNRMWSNFFGQGLVATTENFGLQGELPTNPKLLDWLARDFVDNGWDVKRFCKQVVLSATYRQDSASTGEAIAADPNNVHLARGPAYRLSAEQIRDTALSASGLLNPAFGGPPVSPYQAGGDLWKESNGMSPPYQQSVGRALYRRSLYSVWKRTAPLPNMMAFDAESREVCIVKRARTNTPLQALVLLNDVQFVEAARNLAETSMTQNGSDSAAIAWAFRSLTGRNPSAKESTILEDLLASERHYYQGHPSDADKYVSLGDTSVNKDQDRIELAAMTTVCQTIMNLDATIWKR